jgi:hypothetical protein
LIDIVIAPLSVPRLALCLNWFDVGLAERRRFCTGRVLLAIDAAYVGLPSGFAAHGLSRV